MNWEAFWDQQAAAAKPEMQVGRVYTGSQSAAQLQARIAAHIHQRLALETGDRLLDVCCGNGQLTRLLAKDTAYCLGVDFSEKLLALAKSEATAPNVHFSRATAFQLSGLGRTFNKINLYFSFQYFEDYASGLQVLSEMNSLLEPGGRIFIGDTPDATRWSNYYNTPRKAVRYYYQKWRGTEAMGKFWHPKEFEKMAEWLGLELQILDEPADLPYAWYRFDAVFVKPLA